MGGINIYLYEYSEARVTVLQISFPITLIKIKGLLQLLLIQSMMTFYKKKEWSREEILWEPFDLKNSNGWGAQQGIIIWQGALKTLENDP